MLNASEEKLKRWASFKVLTVQFSTWQSKFAKHEGGLQASTWNKTQWVSFPITSEHYNGRISLWQMKKQRSISLKKKKKATGWIVLKHFASYPNFIHFFLHEKQSYRSGLQQKQRQQILGNCGDRPKYLNVQQDVGRVAKSAIPCMGLGGILSVAKVLQ